MKYGPKPTETQLRELCNLIYWAFLDIRQAGLKGDARRAAALAEAFHNLPTVMFGAGFSWEWFQQDLETYKAQYPGGRDYVAHLIQIQQEGQSFQ